jgi:ABC-type multidrug transport system fused ATPase/permease subunit
MFKKLTLLFWSLKQSFRVAPFLFVVSVVLSIVSSVFFIFYSKLQGNLIDSFSQVQENIKLVISSAIFLLIFTLCRDVFDYFSYTYLRSVIRDKEERYYSKLFLYKYSSLDIGRIEQPEFQNLKSKVSDRSLWRLRNIPDDTIRFIGAFVALITGSGIIFNIHWVAALSVILGTIPAFIVQLFYDKARRVSWDQLSVERRRYHAINNTLDSKRTMQELVIANKTKSLMSYIDSYLEKSYIIDMGVEKKFVIPNILVKVLETVSIGVALYYIILQGANGILSVGDVVFAFGVLYSVSGSLSRVVSGIGSMSENLPYIKDCKDYFETKPLLERPEDAKKISGEVCIEFKNVSFYYPESNEKILNNISFKINPSQKVALVGLNGSGKTTIIKLILRMYDVSEGSIEINGVDIRKIDLSSWYESAAVLLQDFSRYEFLSIKESVKLFAKQDLADSDIWKLIKQVNAETIVDHVEQGINLVQSSEFGGKELSGGQFQKIAIARTLSRESGFIILDEPTSAIDALSEEVIFDNLNQLSKDKTLLFISHRFNTIRNADYIFVIKDGCLAEEGNHELLMRNNHLYTQMYNTQVLGKKS